MRTRDPLAAYAAALSMGVCLLLLIDTLAPNTLTLPRIAGAQISHTTPSRSN